MSKQIKKGALATGTAFTLATGLALSGMVSPAFADDVTTPQPEQAAPEVATPDQPIEVAAPVEVVQPVAPPAPVALVEAPKPAEPAPEQVVAAPEQPQLAESPAVEEITEEPAAAPIQAQKQATPEVSTPRLVVSPANTSVDVTAPKFKEKAGNTVVNGRQKQISFALSDNDKVDYYTINGVKTDVSNNQYSDANNIKVGSRGAVEGLNTIVLYDVSGNSASATFILDASGPQFSVKSDSKGSDGVYRVLSLGLFDAANVDKVVINGVMKDLTNNQYSNVDGLKPGTFGAVEGENTIVAYDELGNTSSMVFIIDVTNPALNMPSGGVVGGSKTFSVTQTEANPSTLYVEHQKLVNGKWQKIRGAEYKGTNSVDYTVDTTGLDEAGTYQLKVTSKDKAGNSSSATVGFTVDNTAPTLKVKPESIGSDDVFRNVSFKLSDNDKVAYYAINGVVTDVTDNRWSDANFITAGSRGAVEGENTIVLYDVAGNSATYTFVIDTIKPVLHMPAGGVINGTETFSVTQTEANPDRMYVEAMKMVDGKWQKFQGAEYKGTNSADFTVDTTDLDEAGVYQLKVSTWDKATNHTSSTVGFTVDNTNPGIKVKDDMSTTADGGYEMVSFKLSDKGQIDKAVINGVVKDLSNDKWSDVNYVKPGMFGAVLGENTIVVYDVAGNTTTLEFTLVAPTPDAPVEEIPDEETPGEGEDEGDDNGTGDGGSEEQPTPPVVDEDQPVVTPAPTLVVNGTDTKVDTKIVAASVSSTPQKVLASTGAESADAGLAGFSLLFGGGLLAGLTKLARRKTTN